MTVSDMSSCCDPCHTTYRSEKDIELTNDGLRFTMTLPLTPEIIVEADQE